MSAPFPAWVLPQASFDLDFINARYFGGTIDTRTVENPLGLMTDGGAYGGANPYTPTRSGVLFQGKPGQNRITDLGLFVERSTTNVCLWCRDLTQTSNWAAVNCTATKNQVGADGASGVATLLTATSSVTSTMLQTITVTSEGVIFSAYVKRVSGTGAVKMTTDGSTFTDITSQLSTTAYAWIQLPVQTLTTIVCGFSFAVSGDSIAVDFCQAEKASLTGQLATTPMLTTNATYSRTNAPGYFQNSAQVGTSANDGQRIINNVFKRVAHIPC